MNMNSNVLFLRNPANGKNIARSNWQKNWKTCGSDETKALGWLKLMEELLETDIPDYRSLTTSNMKTTVYDPNILMDLRHEQVRKLGSQKQKCCKHSVISEARRLIRKEKLERLRCEQEAKNIDTELENFKTQLQKQRDMSSVVNKNTDGSSVTRTLRQAASVTNITCVSNVKHNEKSTNTSTNLEYTKRGKKQDSSDANIALFTDVERCSSSSDTSFTNINQNSTTNISFLHDMKSNTTNIESFSEINQDDSGIDSISLINMKDSVDSEDDNKPYLLGRSQENVITQISIINNDDPENVKVMHKLGKGTKSNDSLPQELILAKCEGIRAICISPLKRNEDSLKEQKKEDLQVRNKHDLTLEPTSRHLILRLYWNRWVIYIQHRRVFKQLKVTKTRSTNFQYESEELVHKILAKYWKKWQEFVIQTKESKLKQNENKNKLIYIDKFLKNIQNKKSSVKHKNNSVGEKTNSINYGTVIKKKNSVRFYPVANNKNEYQLSALKKIVDQQRKELHEKNQRINELQIMSELEKAKAEIKEELKQTVMNSTDADTKIKGKLINEQPTDYSKRTLKFNPPRFLLKMEERYKERKERWQVIKDRKYMMEKEREEKRERIESEMKKKEIEKKIQMIEEIKKKRETEKQLQLLKEREKEKMQQNLKKAATFYRNLLLKKYGLTPFIKLVAIRHEQIQCAQSFRENKLLLRCLLTWNIYTEEQNYLRNEKATQHYNHYLQSHSLKSWLELHREYKRKLQVAVDFYNMKLSERSFQGWHCWVSIIHLEMSYALQYAQSHYDRRLLKNCLKAWCRLPSVVKEEKELEERKEVWRKKVREVLPTFQSKMCLD